MTPFQIWIMFLGALGLGFDFCGALLLVAAVKSKEDLDKIAEPHSGFTAELRNVLLLTRDRTLFSLYFLMVGFGLQLLAILTEFVTQI